MRLAVTALVSCPELSERKKTAHVLGVSEKNAPVSDSNGVWGFVHGCG